MARLRSLWRNLVRRERVDADLDEELQTTLDLLVEDKVRSGMTPEAARRAARIELGSLDSLKGQVQDARTGATLDSLLQDVRYALRLFRRAPGFTTVAILTLALGIGANAAIFGVVKSVLIDALPYTDADRLARVQVRIEDGGSIGRPALSAAMVQAIVSRQKVFESTAAFDGARDAVLGRESHALLVTRSWVEPGFFRTLGVRAALGRTFEDGDQATGHVPASGAERGPDNARGIVVTHAAWQRLFSGDPDVVGRDVAINAIPRTVVGVLPHDFIGPMGPVDFFFAFELAPSAQSGAWWLGLVGRLKPGMTQEAAARDIAAAWASRDTLKELTSVTMTAVPLRDSLVGRTRTPLLVLLLSAALVLLVACANLAGALLARGLSRRKEFAVRVALGVGRGRLLRQLLTESAVLALAGGAAGLLLAQWLLHLLRGLAGPALPSYAVLSLDPGVVLVTAAVSLGTGLAFGVAPALSVERLDAQGALREDARGASEGHRPRRLRGVLVAAQMAVCVTLLAGAGLLARSLWEMATAPFGFEPQHVLSATVRLLPSDYPTLESRTRFRERLLERLRTMPGVQGVAIANKPPALDPRRDGFAIEGMPEDTVQKMVVYASVSDDYFRTLKIPLRRGRTFDASDVEKGPPVAVIGEGLARRYWPGGDPLGARIRLGGQLVTVVGLVGDVRLDLSQLEAEPATYRSHRQESTGRLCVLIRAQGDPLALVKPLEREVAELDPTLPIQTPRALATLVEDVLDSRRLPLMLIGAFGTLALLLASVGVYGMFAGMAAAREREFAVRVALGSGPGAIAGLLLRQGFGWMAAGLLVGGLGIVMAARLLRGWVYGVPAFDPIALGSALAALVACATVALLVPVRRATRVDPIVALRAE